MKYPTKLSDTVHVLTFLALHPGTALTSERIAESVRTNPAYIRQLMSALRKAGLLISVKGHPRPALVKEPEDISLLDVYRAIEGDKPILHQDTHTNPDCGVGVNIQLTLRDYYDEIQKAAEDCMRTITLQNIIDTYRQKAGVNNKTEIPVMDKRYVCIKDQIQNMNLVIGCTVGCPYCYARSNVQRYRMIDDFSKPEFFPGKLRLMEKERPQNFLLTGMSDLAGWKAEWREQVFSKMAENPQHQFLFLSKRPDLLDIDTDLDNAWFGVTVTRRSELWRIDALRENVRAKHYHVTFEPLFDDPGKVDFGGIDWVVIGTMTGPQSRKVRTAPEWVYSLTKQAHALNIPVFWKEDLVPIMGEDMVQELPDAYNRVLEEQKKWRR